MDYSILKNLGKDRKLLLAYVEACGLNPHFVGDEFAQGLQHRIYDYGKNFEYIIKVPKISFLNKFYGILSYKDVVEDLNILNKIMPEFMIETHHFLCSEFNLYTILQKKIDQYLFMTEENMSLVAEEFKLFIRSNSKMINTFGRSVDHFGKEGLFTSIGDTLSKRRLTLLLTNIVIVKRNDKFHIKILDTNLLRIRNKGVPWRRTLIDNIVLGLTNWAFGKKRF